MIDAVLDTTVFFHLPLYTHNLKDMQPLVGEALTIRLY
jgi:hypothetical protein